MIVVLANVNESDFSGMTVGSSTYADLQKLFMTRADNNTIFPKRGASAEWPRRKNGDRHVRSDCR